jgi:filamentous hemagglutinin family protein
MSILGNQKQRNNSKQPTLPLSRYYTHNIAVLLYLMVLHLGANAQVVVDNSFGSSGALNGPNFKIPDTLGKTVGGNLFHSFNEFSLQSGQLATFTGPDSIQNILGRVTGGKVSELDGLIQSEIADANLYLLNPKGFLFGENAKVDVDGAFTVSTRESINLGD